MNRSPARTTASTRVRKTRRLLAAAALGAAGAGHASAQSFPQTFIWNGTSNSFWDDADGLDWIDPQTQETTVAPFGGPGTSALINNGGTAIIRRDLNDIQDIFVGDTANQASTLIHIAGSTQPPQGTPGSMVIGPAGTAGTYVMSGIAIQSKPVMLIGSADNTATPGGQGTLEMHDSARFIGNQFGVGIGGSFEQRSVGNVFLEYKTALFIDDWLRLDNGIMQAQGSASASIGGDLWVGQDQTNQGELTLAQSSRFEVAGDIRVGLNGAAGKLILQDNASLLHQGGNKSYISVAATGNGSTGLLKLSDQASLVSTTNLVLAETGALAGVVEQNGGYVELRDNPDLQGLEDALEIDPTGNNLGRYYMRAGTLKVQTLDATTGLFDFTGGRLMVSERFKGDFIQQGGVFAPGSSPGEVTIEGDYFLNSDEEAGVLEIELAGTVPASEHDKLNIIGDVNLASGILRVLLYESFVPLVGDSFDFMDWTGTLTGQYEALQLPALGNMTWDTRELHKQGILKVMLAGDTDGDGDVDDTDLGTAFANYTGPGVGTGSKTPFQGDTDNDGDVDDSDLGSAFANYTGPLAPANVPEPASALLLCTGLTLGLRRQRR